MAFEWAVKGEDTPKQQTIAMAVFIVAPGAPHALELSPPTFKLDLSTHFSFS